MHGNREDAAQWRASTAPPDMDKRLRAVAAWADHNAPRFADRPLEDAFEEMVAEVGANFYYDTGEWHMEADAVHQVVLGALKDARAGLQG
jgi:hypothetical protein